MARQVPLLKQGGSFWPSSSSRAQGDDRILVWAGESERTRDEKELIDDCDEDEEEANDEAEQESPSMHTHS